MTSDDEKICAHQMNIRPELPCKHELCMSCIKNLVEKTGRSDSLSCPKCSSLFALSFVPTDSTNPSEYVREKCRNEITTYHGAGVIQYKGKIKGMALMGDELFIVRQSPSNVIFKYDISASNRGPGQPVELCISRMKYPRGIAASETSSCLYITDWHKMFGGRLWRYKYQKGQETKQEDPVAIIDVQPFGVSVSQKTDEVLVTCATPANLFVRRGWIYIYKPSGSDFRRIRKIELPDLEIPRHSIRTPSTKFIVCHGWSTKSHGVTSYLDDKSEQIKKQSFYGKLSGGGSGEQEMNQPQDKDGLILVADYHNHRIQLLTEDLHLVRHLVTKGITYPRHICQHAKTGRIYVGQKDGKIQIFDA